MPKTKKKDEKRLSARLLAGVNYQALDENKALQVLRHYEYDEDVEENKVKINQGPCLGNALEIPFLSTFKQGSRKLGLLAPAVDGEEVYDLIQLESALERFFQCIQADPKAQVDELLVPVAENRGGRQHWVLLHIRLPHAQSPCHVEIIDPKGTFSRYYSYDGVRKQVEKFFENVKFSNTYHGHQNIKNDWECGYWVNAYIQQVAEKGVSITKPEMSQEKVKGLFNRFHSPKRNAWNEYMGQRSEEALSAAEIKALDSVLIADEDESLTDDPVSLEPPVVTKPEKKSEVAVASNKDSLEEWEDLDEKELALSKIIFDPKLKELASNSESTKGVKRKELSTIAEAIKRLIGNHLIAMKVAIQASYPEHFRSTKKYKGTDRRARERSQFSTLECDLVNLAEASLENYELDSEAAIAAFLEVCLEKGKELGLEADSGVMKKLTEHKAQAKALCEDAEEIKKMVEDSSLGDYDIS